VVDEQRENNDAPRVGGCTGKGFLPGVSGNPNGRPRGKRFRELALEYLWEPIEGIEPTTTRMSALVQRLVLLAIRGDMRAAKLLLDRIDPPLRVDVQTEHREGVEQVLANLRSLGAWCTSSFDLTPGIALCRETSTCKPTLESVRRESQPEEKATYPPDR